MSSTLSTVFYLFALGIPLIILGILVFLYYNPSVLLQLTSKSGLAVDLTSVNNYNPANAASVFGTEAGAVIKIGANSFAVANDTVGLAYLPNALVAPNAAAKSAADDLAGSAIRGTLMFWVIMLGIGALGLIFAYIGISKPEWFFGDQVAAMVRCLPKTNGCSVSTTDTLPTATVTQPSSSNWMNPIQQPLLVQQPTQPVPQNQTYTPQQQQILALQQQIAQIQNMAALQPDQSQQNMMMQQGMPAQNQLPQQQPIAMMQQTGMPAQNQLPFQQPLPPVQPVAPAQPASVTQAQMQALMQAFMQQLATQPR